MNRRIGWALVIAALPFCAAHAAPPAVVLTEVVRGLSSPVDIRFAPGVANRMFVVEQGGLIRVTSGNQILGNFLDLRSIISTGSERGLLGLAFHPDYATNRRFYVYYTAPNGAVTIARYLRSTSNADLADPASGLPLLSIPHGQEANHNGGGLHFGPDRLLYASTGDGGGGGDPFGNGQAPGERLGKMLRIDVSTEPGYTIPAGNMFPAGGSCATTGCPEILHMGLRNPWRFSFDRLNGDLYIGDVGQDAIEEIDWRPAGSSGVNFGWGIFEGNNCFRDNYFGPSGACAGLTSHLPPVITYGHSLGVAVTGGFVYRGANVVGLGGYYVYGDYSSARLWAARRVNNVWQNDVLLPPTLTAISTFGQDEQGEVYVADLGLGRIYRFDAANGAPSPAADADGDGIPNGVEGQRGRDPSVKDNDVFGDPTLFAMQQYRDFLAREGDGTGVLNWANAVASGSLTREQVIESFFDSAEHQNGLPQVIRLYFAFFDRIPDYAGMRFHVARYRAGIPLATIGQDFAASQEFMNRYGPLTNAAYVDTVYQNVLGRPADPDGRATWLNALDNGGMTRGAMMVAFSESQENLNLTGPEVFVTSIYAGMLRRSPDVQGLQNWTNAFGMGMPRTQMLGAFMSSTEYYKRFLP